MTRHPIIKGRETDGYSIGIVQHICMVEFCQFTPRMFIPVLISVVKMCNEFNLSNIEKTIRTLFR